MGELAEQLKQRLRTFALDCMALADRLPTDSATQYLARQLTRASGGAAANYRAACRARSHAEFTAKIGVAAEECDESIHWLDMLSLRRTQPQDEVNRLLAESNELTAILASSYGTAKRRAAQQKAAPASRRGKP